MASSTIRLDFDASEAVRKARIIAKHLAAMADELEQPDGIIRVDGKLTAKRAIEIREAGIQAATQRMEDMDLPGMVHFDDGVNRRIARQLAEAAQEAWRAFGWTPFDE